MHDTITSLKHENKTSDKSFGVTFFVVFSIVCGLRYHYQAQPSELYIWGGIACLFLIVAFTIPQILRPLNRLWYLFGIALSKITGPIILGLIFYSIFTPISLLLKIIGYDPLRLKKSKDVSYWIERTPPGPKGETLKNQF